MARYEERKRVVAVLRSGEPSLDQFELRIVDVPELLLIRSPPPDVPYPCSGQECVHERCAQPRSLRVRRDAACAARFPFTDGVTKAGDDGVRVDVSNHGAPVGVVVDGSCNVSAAEQRPVSVVEGVEPAGVGVLDPVHSVREPSSRTPHQEMKVVAHHAMRVEFDLASATRPRDQGLEVAPLQPGPEGLHAVDTAIHHVEPTVRTIGTGRSGHRNACTFRRESVSPNREMR